MAGRRYAVLIGNATFQEERDPKFLPELRCPVRDVEELARILAMPQHGSYSVTSLVNKPYGAGREAIYKSLSQTKHNDLVLIYYSGHGKLDESGNLYLAMADSTKDLLPIASIPIAEIKMYAEMSPASGKV